MPVRNLKYTENCPSIYSILTNKVKSKSPVPPSWMVLCNCCILVRLLDEWHSLFLFFLQSKRLHSVTVFFPMRFETIVILLFSFHAVTTSFLSFATTLTGSPRPSFFKFFSHVTGQFRDRFIFKVPSVQNFLLNNQPIWVSRNNPAGIYMFKINNRNTRTRCVTCSKSTIKTPKQRHWHRSGVFIVNFEHVSHLVLVFYC